MSHTQEAYLRSLGMDTQLKNGVVSLTKKFIVCKEGEPLTVNQANILRALEMKLATSCVKLLGVYKWRRWMEKFCLSDGIDKL